MSPLAWQSMYLLFTERTYTAVHQGTHRIPNLRISGVGLRMLIMVIPSAVQKWEQPPCLTFGDWFGVWETFGVWESLNSQICRIPEPKRPSTQELAPLPVQLL